MDEIARDFAWRVHGLQEAWTAKVDTKASIALAFEGGLAIAFLTTQDWLIRSAGAVSGTQILGMIGMGLMLSAVCFAGAVVLPFVGPARRQHREAIDNTVYFGHLRHWQSEELAERLAAMNRSDEMLMLSRQIIVMSRINWRKHWLLRISLILTLLAGSALTISVIDHIN